jgi:hypothetical protein
MQQAAFAGQPATTIWNGFLDAVALHGRGRRMLEDARETEETYGRRTP